MDLIIATIFGSFAGLLVGLVPAFGTTVLLLLTFPFLVEQSFIFCITFYCVLSSVSQYFGSITALSFGIPGESSSVPLLSIRSYLLSNNKLNDAQFLCAYGSLIASVLSGIMFFIFIYFFAYIIIYLKTYISLFFAVLGLILCLFISSNSKIVSLFFILLGWFFSKIGYSNITHAEFMTFDNIYLYSGIPALPLILGIYAIPSLLKMYSSMHEIIFNSSYESKNIDRKYLITSNTWVIIRSSLIGFISGLVPYVGNSMSSYFAFFTQKSFNKKDILSQATASESANNAANISVLIPLLFLGIAIVPSEYVLLEILLANNQPINWESIYEYSFLLLSCMFVANLIAFFISWRFIRFLNYLILNLKNWLPILLLCATSYLVYFIGFEQEQTYYYVLVLILASSAGLFLRRFDLLPFVYAFLLQNNIEQIIYKVYRIYL